MDRPLVHVVVNTGDSKALLPGTYGFHDPTLDADFILRYMMDLPHSRDVFASLADPERDQVVECLRSATDRDLVIRCTLCLNGVLSVSQLVAARQALGARHRLVG